MIPTSVRSQKILIAGASGFLGKFLASKLADLGFKNLTLGAKPRFDFTDLSDCSRATKDKDLVINAVGFVTSRKGQEVHPAEVFYVNTLTNLQLLEACCRNGVKKVVVIGSITGYPERAESPLKEKELFTGEVVAIKGRVGFYGLSKWLVPQTALAYHLEYGLNIRLLIFPNLYGPRDKFDHEPPPLVPNLVKNISRSLHFGERVFVAGGNPLSRLDLLYIDDAVDALICAITHEDNDGFVCVNAGSEKSVTIKAVCKEIARTLGFKGKIVWENKLGSPPRFLDNARIKSLYGWRPKVDLKSGIARTCRWFKKNYAHEKIFKD